MALPELIGFDWSIAEEYLPDEELLVDIASDFRDSLDDYYVEIDKFINDINNPDSLNEYEVNVHAIKGSLKMLGNMEVSDLAKDCEFAAKDKNIDRIMLLTPQLIEKLHIVQSELGKLS